MHSHILDILLSSLPSYFSVTDSVCYFHTSPYGRLQPQLDPQLWFPRLSLPLSHAWLTFPLPLYCIVAPIEQMKTNRLISS